MDRKVISKHILFRQHIWACRIGEHPGAVRNHRRNLSDDRKQPCEFPIDPGQRVLERRGITQLTRIVIAIADSMNAPWIIPSGTT
jgi:hypothetical protein